MQIVGHLARIEWLEEGLDHIAEAHDQDVQLIHGFSRQSVQDGSFLLPHAMLYRRCDDLIIICIFVVQAELQQIIILSPL